MRCGSLSLPSPIHASAASRANCYSTASRATRGSTIGEGVGAYWSYEKWLRRHESLVGSIVGSTGAIYALRRELWQPLPAETILDDVLAPMRAVLAGARVVFEGSARAYDRVAAAQLAEYRRKTRTLAGNYQILRLRAAAPGPVRESGLDSIRVAQARTPASCRTRSARSWFRALPWPSHTGSYADRACRPARLLRPRVLRRRARATRTSGAARALDHARLREATEASMMKGTVHE